MKLLLFLLFALFTNGVGKDSLTITTVNVAYPSYLMYAGTDFNDLNPGVLIDLLRMVEKEMGIAISFNRFPDCKVKSFQSFF